MDQRLRPVRRKVLCAVGAGLLACGPWIGWWTLLPLLVVTSVFEGSDFLARRVSRPELVMFQAWVVTEIVIACSLVLIGELALLCALAIPAPTLASRFSERGIVVGTSIAITLVGATAVAIDPGFVAANPQVVLAPSAVVLAVTWFMKDGVVRDDFEYRSRVLADPLTGVFNRLALDIQSDELEQHCRQTGEGAALLAIDIDDFKGINDSLGHVLGDSVLQEVCVKVRNVLRPAEKIFRPGGDEFVVLLAGASAEQAEEIANRVCSAVSGGVFQGRRVTISCGVAATMGDGVDVGRLLVEADAALYKAKDLGRNRVDGAGSGPNSSRELGRL